MLFSKIKIHQLELLAIVKAQEYNGTKSTSDYGYGTAQELIACRLSNMQKEKSFVFACVKFLLINLSSIFNLL